MTDLPGFRLAELAAVIVETSPEEADTANLTPELKPANRLERLTQWGFRLEEFEADQAAADREEGFVDVIAAFVADAQPSVLVQPGDRTLDDPPLRPKPRSVPALGPGDLRLDVAAS